MSRSWLIENWESDWIEKNKITRILTVPLYNIKNEKDDWMLSPFAFDNLKRFYCLLYLIAFVACLHTYTAMQYAHDTSEKGKEMGVIVTRFHRSKNKYSDLSVCFGIEFSSMTVSGIIYFFRKESEKKDQILSWIFYKETIYNWYISIVFNREKLRNRKFLRFTQIFNTSTDR